MSTLTFKSTMSVAEFKQAYGVSTIDVYKNPNTNKTAFSTDRSDIKGAVSGEFEEIKLRPAISLVEGDQGEFFMLHKRSESNTIGSL
jgi:hypothetical protein